MLKQFFNAALVSANLHDTSKEGDPVTDSMLGTEGKFGFIEFRTIAEATSCIALNNIELGGKQLRIERPRDYAPMPEAMLDELRKQVMGILGATCGGGEGGSVLRKRLGHAVKISGRRGGGTFRGGGGRGIPEGCWRRCCMSCASR
jgi:hypothetical protein